jgi:PAS domain S-box-containing protein
MLQQILDPVNGNEVSHEHRIVRPDGEVRWVHVRGKVQFADEDGQERLIRSTGLMIDITDRKRAEEALRRKTDELDRRTRELDAFLASVQDPVYILDATGRFLYANQALLDLWGLTAERAMGRRMRDLDYSEAVERKLMAGVQQVFETGHVARNVTEYTSPTGGTAVYENLLAPIQGPDGLVVLVAGSSRDITEQKRAERELRESEESLRLALSVAKLGIFDWDVPNDAVRWDERMYEIFGRTHEEGPINAEGFYATALHPDDRDEFDAHMAAAIQNRTVFTPTVRIFRQHDGDVRWIRYRGRFEFAADGSPKRLLGIVADVTEEKRAEEALRAHRNQLSQLVEERTAELQARTEELFQAQKMEAVGRLAGGIAHDFNNLMQVVIGWSQRLLNRDPDPHVLRRGLQVIADTGTKAAQLTRQLLAFGSKQVMDLETVDLGCVTEDLMPMLDRLLSEAVKLNYAAPDGPVQVKADPSQLEQVIMNLAVNARDAMPRGGRLSIEVREAPADVPVLADKSERYAELRVSDTGHGMDAETIDRIFEPFFSTKPPGKGTGLGLSTTFGIVKQTGGEIAVSSELERGTTFSVYLPLAESTEAGEEGRTPTSGPAKDARLQGTVLVVEDEASVRALTVLELEELGLQVLEAGALDEALDEARRHDGDIDLLLTDMMLQGEDGGQVAEAVREHHPEIQVLYMSGYSPEHVEQRVERMNGEFIQKPFSSDELAAKVKTVLLRQ